MALLDGPARSLGISLDERCDLGEVVGDLNGLAGTGEWDLDPGRSPCERVGLLTFGISSPHSRGSDLNKVSFDTFFYDAIFVVRLAGLKIPSQGDLRARGLFVIQAIDVDLVTVVRVIVLGIGILAVGLAVAIDVGILIIRDAVAVDV